MAAVGIRELKSDFGKYLKRVGLGERITVTDRGGPIAVLVPIEEPSTAAVQSMIADGTAHWTGETVRIFAAGASTVRAIGSSNDQRGTLVISKCYAAACANSSRRRAYVTTPSQQPQLFIWTEWAK
jgi:prevent-host-death family protein